MILNIEKIREFATQCQKFMESNTKLVEMISTEKIDKVWSDHFHLIDHDWLIKWKDLISFDKLIKQNIPNNNKDYSNICKVIEENIQNINIDNLDNKSIYYDNLDKVDPMKPFDIITDEVWRLFDLKNENLKYNGKVSILKGNRKIIIRFDDNNYFVKYRTNDNQNLFGEFVMKFNNQENEGRTLILNKLSEANIYDWMKEVDFKDHPQNFTIDKDGIPFDIIQKTNNYCAPDKSFKKSFDISRDVNDDLNNYVSFSICSFSFSSLSINNNSYFSFFSSDEFTSFFSIIKNYRFIQKYNKTTNICCVMRCLSIINPFAEYFMSHRNGMIFFPHFPNLSLVNLIRDFFINLWSNEKSPFRPYEFTKHIMEKTKINIKEEQDPFIFLEFIISYIKRKLKYIDGSQCNFHNIQDRIKDSLTNINELNKIIKENNTIASKCFDGLMLEIYNCEKCKQNFEIIKVFNIITIDYRKIINFLQNEGNSFASLDIDDFLEYYFLRKSINDDKLQSYDCPKCKTESKIINKEILEYPEYLIIRLKEGEFEGNKGFKIEDDIPDISLHYKKIKYMRVYHSKKIESYNKNKLEYNLISMIHYLFEEKDKNKEIRFISICKLVLEFGKNRWVSFSCGSEPQQLEHDYKNNRTFPYILVYQLNK